MKGTSYRERRCENFFIACETTTNEKTLCGGQIIVYQVRKKDDSMKEIGFHLDKLVDTTHGIGTTFIGTLFSFIFWILYSHVMTFTVIILSLVWLGLLIALGRSYYLTLQAIQSIANSTLAGEIINEEPTVIIYSP